MRINKHDTNGTKPLLGKGELGYDDYVAGGDVGRVYVGTGSENIALAEKSEVDSHAGRTDNPHSVTKAQVGLANVDNTSDANKPISTAMQTALDSKVDTSTNQTIGGVKTFSSSLIVPTPTTGTQAVNKDYIDGKYSGFKNYIINGNFSIWQRGTSFSSVGYTADRWYISIGGSAGVMKHNVHPNTILVSTAAASSFANLYQAIETATVVGLRGKTLTLSLKIATGGTHTGGFSLSARYSNSTDTLNSQNTNIQALGISASSTTARYSLTFTVPADAVGLRIDIENTSAQPSGAMYQVQEVQLEEGSVATPFEQRPYGLELSLCQRYYETTLNNVELIKTTGYTAGDAMLNGNTCLFKADKRVIPTITVYDIAKVAGNAHFQAVSSGGNGVNLSASIYTLSSTGFSVGRPSSVGDVGNILFYYTASAEL